MDNAITNLEELREWFMRKNTPYYTLYHGRGVAANMVFHRNRNEISVDDAWMQISDDIKSASYNGGTFTLATRESPKAENILSGKVFIKMYGQAEAVNPGISGIGRTNISEETIKERIKTEMYLYDLERRLEDKEAEIEAAKNETVWHRLGNTIVDHPQLPQMLEMGIAALVGKFGGTTTIQGVPPQQAQSSTIDESLHRISQVFQDVESALHHLSLWIENNPDLAKTFFKEQVNNDD